MEMPRSAVVLTEPLFRASAVLRRASACISTTALPADATVPCHTYLRPSYADAAGRTVSQRSHTQQPVQNALFSRFGWPMSVY